MKNKKIRKHEKYKAKNKQHLFNLIREEIAKNGNERSLNHIDVSAVEDFSLLFFKDKSFNGDISEWDMSNATTVSGMFESSTFNGDISRWNVGKVKNFSDMFKGSLFEGDISKWDTKSAQKMLGMFCFSNFNSDISKWDVSAVEDMAQMFEGAKFNQDISQWSVEKVEDMTTIFQGSNFQKDVSCWKPLSLVFHTDMFGGGCEAPIPYWAIIKEKSLRDRAIHAYHCRKKLESLLHGESGEPVEPKKLKI